MSIARSLAAIALGSSCLFLAPAANAACPNGHHYDVNREIRIKQGNRFTVRCELRQFSQDGPKFRGVCTSNTGNPSTDIDGLIQDSARFKMRVEWRGGAVGIYTGFLDASGSILDGRTFDESRPGNWSTWEFDNMRLLCVKSG
jgi:hypothetical protein